LADLDSDGNVPTTILIKGDSKPNEVSWSFTVDFQDGQGAQLIGTGGVGTFTGSFPTEALYTLVINDSGNNGVCCKFGQGSIQIRNGLANFFANNGQYGSQLVIVWQFDVNGNTLDKNGNPFGSTVAPPPQTTTPPTSTSAPVQGTYTIQLVPKAGTNPGANPSLTNAITALNNAAKRWMTIITQKLSAVNGQSADLVITFDFSPIDGPGQILGQAGPTQLRAGSLLPFSGTMQFDSADITSQSLAELNGLFLHEMGHVLGIGTLWTNKKCEVCTPGASNNNALYNPSGVCPAAVTQFTGTQGTTSTDKLLIELTGGAGTACGHWSEAQLQSELMTGFLTLNPKTGISELSRITVGALQDLGYTCNLNAADNFIFTPGKTSGTRSIEGDTTAPAPVIVETEITSTTPIENSKRQQTIQYSVIGGVIGLVAVVGIIVAVVVIRRRRRNGNDKFTKLVEDRHIALQDGPKIAAV